MRRNQESNPTIRFLQRAIVAEVLFLVISGFFLFTEHRAHYWGALPTVLLVIALTVFLLLRADRKQHRTHEAQQFRGRR